MLVGLDRLDDALAAYCDSLAIIEALESRGSAVGRGQGRQRSGHRLIHD
jgi:hypothetical protein